MLILAVIFYVTYLTDVIDHLIGKIKQEGIGKDYGIISLCETFIKTQLWVFYANNQVFSNSVFPLYQSFDLATARGYPTLGSYPSFDQDDYSNRFKKLLAVPLDCCEKNVADKMNKLIVDFQNMKINWYNMEYDNNDLKDWFYSEYANEINYTIYECMYKKYTPDKRHNYSAKELDTSYTNIVRMFMRQLQRHIVMTQVQLSDFNTNLSFLSASCVQEGHMLFFDGYYTVKDVKINDRYREFQRTMFMDLFDIFYDPDDGLMHSKRDISHLNSNYCRKLELFYIILSSINFGDFVDTLVYQFLAYYISYGSVITEMCKTYVNTVKTTPIVDHAKVIYDNGFKTVLASHKKDTREYESSK